MIQPNELRVGNYVYQSLTDMTESIYQIIKSIAEKCVSTNELNEVVPFNKLDGIPLTPEILEKCGFEKSKCPNWYFKEAKGQKFELFNPVDDSSIHYADGCFGPDLKYLHQIQNLYFALVGEELTVNL